MNKITLKKNNKVREGQFLTPRLTIKLWSSRQWCIDLIQTCRSIEQNKGFRN